ncbi:hypothetical protein WIV_gp112 [Wiseana iridescent virus]|uniref:Uncharacterized protein n=1 Tax=Wiseana iridescent virus TaxID=68347 RepID=G0T5D8_IRV9|nr:hypothetical protein WIV_gp112 [Wiseana iridescent virus]ADO00456.1 hypothetical protein [Wiseana iridescent virus]
MQELIAMAVLLLALVVVIVGFQIKPITSPVLQTSIPQQPIQPQVVPIYFPRPMYPFPRLGYPIRQFPPPIRPPIKLN